jgi:hypothetical protein
VTDPTSELQGGGKQV